MLRMNKLDSGCWVIAVVTALFILPIILSGIMYQDDILRSANGEAYWGVLGRPLSDAVVMAIGFGSDFVVDTFPLSLILSGLLLSASSMMLYCRFALQKGIASGLAFSLFSLSPFFLQNLSYHFDSLPMMLGVFLAVLPYSVAFSRLRLSLRMLSGAICLVMALSLYQATVNVFISICVIEVAYSLYKNQDGYAALRASLERAVTALIGLLIYMKGIAPLFLSKKVHSDLITASGDPVQSLTYNLSRFWKIADSLFSRPFIIAWSALLLLALAGFIYLSFNLIKSDKSALSKVTAIFIAIVCVAISFFSVAGPFVFVDKTVVAPRVMMGLPGLMLLVAFFASTVSHRNLLAVTCCITVVFSLSFASAYGNASKAQRSLEDKVFYDIASSVPRDWKGKPIYITGQIATAPATEMQFKRFPSLKWMVMPVFDWSGMVILKHYNVDATIANALQRDVKDKKIVSDNLFFTLYEGMDNLIVIK